MPVTDTPLRYPGGKSQLLPFVVELLRENDLLYGEYAEPFAGGAGLALSLLLQGYVDRIHINDIDPAIHAFWYSVLHHTSELCELIESTAVTMDAWHEQRQLLAGDAAVSTLKRGFATFFLNRTNRSGILKGGVIGGYSQASPYPLDCRFNKKDLIRKIRRIASYRSQVNLTCLDAIAFLGEVVPNSGTRLLVNLDPPYFTRGPELYMNFYRPGDHERLAQAVQSLGKHWMVTYDDAPEIRQLYVDNRINQYSLSYTAQLKRVGTELMILGPSLRVPNAFRETHVPLIPDPNKLALAA